MNPQQKLKLISFVVTFTLLLGLGYIIFLVDWPKEDKLTAVSQTSNDLENDKNNSKSMERVRAELDGVDSFEPILSLANFDPKIYDVEPVIRLAVQTYDQHGFGSFQQFMQTFKSNVHGRNRLSIGDLQNQALISLISHIYASRSVSAVGFTDTFEKTLKFSGQSRKHMLMSLIDQWTDVEPREAYSTVSLIEPIDFRLWLQYIVLKQWGKKQPRIVMEDLMSFDPRIGWVAEREAMLAIAIESPSEASKYFETGQLYGLELDLVVEIAKSWTKQDPESALDWIQNEENITEFARYSGILSSLVALAQQDPKESLLKALELGPQGRRIGIYNDYDTDVMIQIASDNSLLALELLNKVNHDGRELALALVVGKYLVMDRRFDAALSLGDTLHSNDSEMYASSILGRWSQQDPIHLLQHIHNLPEALVPLAAEALLIENASPKWFQFFDESIVSELEAKLSVDEKEHLERVLKSMVNASSASPGDEERRPAFKIYSIQEEMLILIDDYLNEKGPVFSHWLVNAPALNSPND